MNHREAYPEQYTHPLCGKTVRVVAPNGKELHRGNVRRVISSRFGPLVITDGTDTGVSRCQLRGGDAMRRRECYRCGYRWSESEGPSHISILTECPKCYAGEIGPELTGSHAADSVSDDEMDARERGLPWSGSALL